MRDETRVWHHASLFKPIKELNKGHLKKDMTHFLRCGFSERPPQTSLRRQCTTISIKINKMPFKTFKNKLTWIFGQFSICSSCGMVFVTTTASKHALLMRWMAGPEKIPCVRIAYTFVAPASTSLSAAWTIVPHVSAMSSTKMATRSLTSPT